MSGIFGIVAPQGAQLDPQRFARLGAAMRHWGDGDPTTAAVDGAAMGMCLLRTLPEDHATAMPVRLDDHDLLFAAEGRVDNRDEVCRALGIDTRDAAALADTTIVLKAYLQWGEACQGHLAGDWSLAAWHPRQQRLVLTRDRSSHASLVFHHDLRDGSVVFASDPKALHAAGVPRRPNELYLAQLLISWPGYHGPQTIDLDIVRVPPANVCVIERSGHSMRRTWFPERMSLLQYSSLDEYAEGLLDVLGDATSARCRTVGPIATTLSGGLDSGSVTALAARAAGAHRLAAYTHVPLPGNTVVHNARRFGDETSAASATARHLGIEHHVLLDSAHLSPLDGIDLALASIAEPTHAVSNEFWIHDLLSSAARDGSRVLLTGQGGNATISWIGGRGGPVRRLRDSGPKQALAWFVPAELDRWRDRRRALHTVVERTALRRDVAEQLDLARQWSSSLGTTASRPSRRADGLTRRCAVLQPGAARIGDLWTRHGAFAGLEVRDPTLDWRVVEYCLRTPDRWHVSEQLGRRAVVRRAMTGLLPESVRTGTPRGLQSADIVERTVTHMSAADAALDRIAAGRGSGLVDVDRMRRVLHRIATHPSSTDHIPMTTVVLRGIMAGTWLNGVDI